LLALLLVGVDPSPVFVFNEFKLLGKMGFRGVIRLCSTKITLSMWVVKGRN
jgi:hypothetical protein